MLLAKTASMIDLSNSVATLSCTWLESPCPLMAEIVGCRTLIVRTASILNALIGYFVEQGMREKSTQPLTSIPIPHRNTDYH